MASDATPNSATALLAKDQESAHHASSASKAAPPTVGLQKGDLFGFPDDHKKETGMAAACMAATDQCNLGNGGGQNWSYVGTGQGGYEVVETLVFVGEGKGTYTKDGTLEGAKKKENFTWQRRFYMGTLLFLLAAGIISLLASLILGPKRVSRPVEQQSPPLTHTVQRPLANSPVATAEVIQVTTSKPTQAALSGISALKPSETIYSCHQEAFLTWSPSEREFCCLMEGLGCPQLDCNSGQEAWSPGKKIWCCKHHGKGCVQGIIPTPLTPVPQKAIAKLPSSDLYDCNGSKQGWSPKQEDWCCWHYGTGCPGDSRRLSII